MKTHLGILIALFSSCHVFPGILITGILDGTLAGGMPKAIELFIAGTEDLGGYEIWRSTNGAAFGSGTGSVAPLSGTFSDTFVFLVKLDQVATFHAVFGDSGIYANVIPLSIINGNGNDAFQVRDTSGLVIMDQVWLEDATDSYRDSFWQRQDGTGPDGGWIESNWYTPGNDALDGLDEAGLKAAVPFGTYAIEWTGITDEWSDPLNWNPHMVPSINTNTLVGASQANFPVVRNALQMPAYCMSLTLISGAILSIETGKQLVVSNRY